jgi:hypothetical protein
MSAYIQQENKKEILFIAKGSFGAVITQEKFNETFDSGRVAKGWAETNDLVCIQVGDKWHFKRKPIPKVD